MYLFFKHHNAASSNLKRRQLLVQSEYMSSVYARAGWPLLETYSVYLVAVLTRAREAHINTILLASTLIAHFEGLSLIPYPCPAQYWTIGYGSGFVMDGIPVRKDTRPISAEEAQALLEQHIVAFQLDFRSFTTAPLTEVQEAALLSWPYNIGTGQRLAQA